MDPRNAAKSKVLADITKYAGKGLAQGLSPAPEADPAHDFTAAIDGAQLPSTEPDPHDFEAVLNDPALLNALMGE